MTDMKSQARKSALIFSIMGSDQSFVRTAGLLGNCLPSPGGLRLPSPCVRHVPPAIGEITKESLPELPQAGGFNREVKCGNV